VELLQHRRRWRALRTRVPLIFVALAVGGGAALRCVGMVNSPNVTADEAFTLALAQRPLSGMLHLFTFEANAILYPILGWPLVRAHEGLFVLRLPALVAGLLTIVALYAAGVKIFGRSEAVVASCLLAISPLAVQYSYLARAYVFAMLFGTVAYACMARAADNRLWWLGYIGAMVLAGYSNAVSVPLLLAAQAAWLPLDKRLVRGWVMSVLGVLVGLIPLAVLLLVERSKRDALYWLNRPSLHDILRVGYHFSANRKGLLVAALILVAAFVATRLRDRRLLIPAAWAFLPPLVLLVMSLLKPVFSKDYLTPALPGFMLFLAAAVMRVPLPLRIAGLAGLVGIFLSTTVHSVTAHGTGWREATRALGPAPHLDPVVFDIPDGLVAAGVADKSFTDKHGRLIVNAWSEQPLPPNVALLDDPGGYGRAPSGPPSSRLLARLARRTGTVFVVVYEAAQQGDVARSPGVRWARNACNVEVREYGNVEVIRISACAQKALQRVHRE
jgi:hypothetical protein